MRTHNHYRTLQHTQFLFTISIFIFPHFNESNSTTKSNNYYVYLLSFSSIACTMIQMMCTVSSRFKTILYFILFYFSTLRVCRFFDTSVSVVVGLLLLKIIYISFLFSFCVFLMTHNRPLPVFLTHTKHAQPETMSMARTYVCMQSHTRALCYFLSLSRAPVHSSVSERVSMMCFKTSHFGQRRRCLPFARQTTSRWLNRDK